MTAPGQTDARRIDETHATMAAAAALVERVGRADFGDGVVAFMRACAVFDSALILHYHERRTPSVLAEALAHPLRRNNIDAYLAGAYLLDPFSRHAQKLTQPAVARLSDIAGPDFPESEYFRSYYTHSHLIDEINLLVPLARTQVVAICLGRSKSLPRFGDADLAGFWHWLPIVAAAVRRNAELSNGIGQGSADAGGEREHAQLLARLNGFGSDLLTSREHEVVQLILRGHAANEIAAKLGVSVQTVRVHRRNIYEKLDVSSLGQLFSLATRRLLGEPGPAEDGQAPPG